MVQRGGATPQNNDMVNNDLDGMLPRALICAEQLRSLYAQTFSDDVEGQWHAWLHVAIRRERILQCVQRQLQRPVVWSKMPMAAKKVARQALVLMRRSEGLHARFIEDLLVSRRSEGRTFTADLMIWIAGHEENLLSPLEQRAASVTEAAGLFSICATFEAIVQQAYVHMETLASAREDLAGENTLGNLCREFHVRAIDRAYYEQVFNELAHWASRPLPDRSTPRVCAERLAGLLPRGVSVTGSREVGVVTDAGFAELFVRHRVPLVRA